MNHLESALLRLDDLVTIICKNDEDQEKEETIEALDQIMAIKSDLNNHSTTLDEN